MRLDDGIYIGLPFADYLAQDAMGSSKKGTLWLRREGYYWRYLSPFRARDDEDEAKERLFGSAAHCAILESMHAYETRYAVEPDKRQFPDALFTAPQIKAAFQEAGIHPPGAGSFRKEEWAEAAEVYLPDVVVWDSVIADFERKVGRGRRRLSAEMDFQIRAMRDIALADPQMVELVGYGSEFPSLTEVSIFYTDDQGVRHCARLDGWLPPTTPDLKTLGNWSGEPLPLAVDKHIRRNAYDVQRADYDIARAWAAAAIRADPGVIHGGTAEERDHLEAMAHYDAKLADEGKGPSFTFIFYQKPSASGAAPVLFPVMDRYGGPYHRSGFRKRWHALATYHDCMARFGPDKPWGRVEPIHLSEDLGDANPHIEISPFLRGEPDPVDGEAEYFADGRG